MIPYYTEPGIEIYHGDCREILPTLGKVDLVLTDPPYGIGEAAGKNNSRGNLAKATDYGVDHWDDEPVNWGLLWELLTLGKYACCWGGNYYPVPPSSAWLVWDKVPSGGTTDFADCELAWSNFGGAVRRFKWLWSGYWQHDMKNKEQRVHPTQKPLPLMKWCIGLADKRGEVKTILDPFMGSGTTLRAAKDLGRKAIGIEISQAYCDVAIRRLKQEVLPL